MTDDQFLNLENRAIERDIAEILRTKPDLFDKKSNPDLVMYIAQLATRFKPCQREKMFLASFLNQYKYLPESGLWKGGPDEEKILLDDDACVAWMINLQWHVVEFTGQDHAVLITSDQSVGVYDANPAIVSFPLSRTVAALGYSDDRAKLDQTIRSRLRLVDEVREADEAHVVAWINAMTAFAATEFFTSDPKAWFLLPTDQSPAAAVVEPATFHRREADENFQSYFNSFYEQLPVVNHPVDSSRESIYDPPEIPDKQRGANR